VFAFAKQVMDMDLDKDDANFIRVMVAKQQVMSSMMTAAMRVDSSAMKKKSADKLGSILDDIKTTRRVLTHQG